MEVLFSDKTGTLTKNLMVFKTCSILGQVYEEKEGNLFRMGVFDDSVDTGQVSVFPLLFIYIVKIA